MIDMPERIWLTYEQELWSSYRSFRASDLNHNNADGSPSGYPEYARADIAADRIAALEARLAELTGEAMVERMEQAIAAAWPGAFQSHRIRALARDLLTRAGIIGGDNG
jgi:hypothetical protein